MRAFDFPRTCRAWRRGRRRCAGCRNDSNCRSGASAGRCVGSRRRRRCDGAGFVLPIIIATFSAAISAAIAAAELFISELCEQLNLCSKDAPPIDPDIDSWLGSEAIHVNSVTLPMTQTVPQVATMDSTVYCLVQDPTSSNLALYSANLDPNVSVDAAFTACIPPTMPGARTFAIAEYTPDGQASYLYVLYDDGETLYWTRTNSPESADAWTAPQAVTVSGTSIGSVGQMSLATISGRLYVAAVDNSIVGENRIKYAWLYNDTWYGGNYIRDIPGNFATTLVQPTLVSFRSRLYCIYPAASTHHKVLYTRLDTSLSNWSPIQKIEIHKEGSIQTRSAVAAASFNAKLYVMHRSYHHGFVRWETFDGQNWIGSPPLTVPSTSHNKPTRLTIYSDYFSLAACELTRNANLNRLMLFYASAGDSSELCWTLE